MRWSGHVACREERGNTNRVSVEKAEESKPLARPRHRWRIIVKWILKKYSGRAFTVLLWLKVETSGGLF
jgi:hypothetical protein